jgi:thioredoxin 1
MGEVYGEMRNSSDRGIKQFMPINSVIHTNGQSIDRVLRAGLPLLLVFWQRTAPQAAELDPVLNQLAERYAGRALIAKIDAESESDLIKRFDVRLLPTLVAVNRQGNVETTMPGRIADEAAKAWLTFLVEGGARPATASGPGIPAATGQPLPANGTHYHSAGQPATARDKTGAPQTISDANFDQVINSKIPVLVDFWAEWCGPCRMVAPSVEHLAQEFAGRAIVAKLNVDHNPVTARRYQIMSIPALYIFKDGQIIDKMVGAQPLPVLRQRLARAVGG